MNNELSLPIKQCHTCKEIKPLLDFCRNKRIKDGHHTECKACVKIYQSKNLYENINSNIQNQLTANKLVNGAALNQMDVFNHIGFYYNKDDIKNI